MIKRIWDWLFNPCQHNLQIIRKPYEYWVYLKQARQSVKHSGETVLLVCKKCGKTHKKELK